MVAHGNGPRRGHGELNPSRVSPASDQAKYPCATLRPRTHTCNTIHTFGKGCVRLPRRGGSRRRDGDEGRARPGGYHPPFLVIEGSASYSTPLCEGGEDGRARPFRRSATELPARDGPGGNRTRDRPVSSRRIRVLHCAKELILIILFICCAEGKRNPPRLRGGRRRRRAAAETPPEGSRRDARLHYRRFPGGRDLNSPLRVRSNRCLQYAAFGATSERAGL